MADRSPSKPRRSLTPEASDPPLPPPPQASGSSSRDEADDIDDSDAAEESDVAGVGIGAGTRSSELEGRVPTKPQHVQEDDKQQQRSPGSAQHPSPGATSSSAAAAEDAVVDRSPSKPKRVTSPPPPAGPHPPFHRTGSLRFSLREDPEPGPSIAAGAPSAGTHSPPFPISMRQPQASSSLPCARSSGASHLLPPPSSQQPLPYSTYAQWQGSLSSSLHHRHLYTMDDESTQTWNESTQTFATSSAWFDAPALALGGAAFAAEEGGARRATYRERGNPPRNHHDDDDNNNDNDGDDDHADDAASDAEAVPSREGTGVAEAAEAPAESSGPNSSGTTPEKSNSSPGSSNDRSPTSASMSLASLTGAPHPAPASTIAVRRQRPRRGDAIETIGASASVASASTTSVSTTFRPVLTMEVAPGVSRPLWHSDVTRTAVTQGRARECVCSGCRTALYYVPRAAYVLCPVCSTVGPLLAPLPPQPTGATEAAAPGGGAREAEERPDASAICVGVKRDDPPSSPSRA